MSISSIYFKQTVFFELYQCIEEADNGGIVNQVYRRAEKKLVIRCFTQVKLKPNEMESCDCVCFMNRFK